MFRYEMVAAALVYSMKKIQNRNGQPPIINGKQTFEIIGIMSQKQANLLNQQGGFDSISIKQKSKLTRELSFYFP
jgi:hypothetical protein